VAVTTGITDFYY